MNIATAGFKFSHVLKRNGLDLLPIRQCHHAVDETANNGVSLSCVPKHPLHQSKVNAFVV